jgi:fimbrial isopeptide formation D2 family protein/LPXTG-motif cell wall-anchored protein
MKNFKKFGAVLLALALAVSCFTMAFAVSAKDHTYEIYQVFTGDYSDGILSNVKWGANSTGGTVGQPVSAAVLEAIEATTSETSDQAKLDAIKPYVNLSSTPLAKTPTISTDGSTVTYTGLDNGYYLVKDKNNTQTGENGYYTLYIVDVVDNQLVFHPKGDLPSVEKFIVENGDKKFNEASMGDVINYKLVGTVPSDIADYRTYFYKFNDILSKGLTFVQDSIKIYLNSVDDENEVTTYFYQSVAPAASDSTQTEIFVSIADLKSLALLPNTTIDQNTQVIVTYQAKLNTSAVIAGSGNPNSVNLTYSNDPNNSGTPSTEPDDNPNNPMVSTPTGLTPTDQVVTYTTNLKIYKTDSDEENPSVLPGTQFQLTGDAVNVVLVIKDEFDVDLTNGTYYKLKDGTYTTDAPTGAENDSEVYDDTETTYSKVQSVVAKGSQNNTDVIGTIDPTGYVTFSGLGVGTYTLTEVTTLPGYNTIDPITFTIGFNRETKAFTSSTSSITVESDNTLYTNIINSRGSELPKTGGIGTTIFYIIGSVLVVAAAVVLITRKRMNGMSAAK